MQQNTTYTSTKSRRSRSHIEGIETHIYSTTQYLTHVVVAEADPILRGLKHGYTRKMRMAYCLRRRSRSHIEGIETRWVNELPTTISKVAEADPILRG
ncbi:MAG: hypothetical protein DRO87_07415 [Candidatus Thorarchaeota archaeon]|nr:MAG: hypothetical protein DRO87_07415 [Candidatus Thorarchaeota archaeon]